MLFKESQHTDVSKSEGTSSTQSHPHSRSVILRSFLRMHRNNGHKDQAN